MKTTLINKIRSFLTFDETSCKIYPTDLWINNSFDGEGEDIQVECITPNGLEMADGDFFEYEELNEEELEMILDVLSPNTPTDKADDKRINDTKDLYNLVCRTLTDEPKETRVAILDSNYFSEEEIEYFMKCGETELEMLLEDDESQTCCSYTLQDYADIVNSNPMAFTECYIRIYGE